MLPTLPALLFGAGSLALVQGPSDATSIGDRPALPDADGVSARLAAIVEAHPDIASLETYGRSASGQPLEVLALAREGDGRPGLLVIAGLDPDHPFEPWLAVELAQRAAYAAEGDAQGLLESYDLFVIPLADPDGQARSANGGLAGQGPDADDDRDGRRGEDPPSDVDGDGRVLQLRVPDPDGGWIADPHDERAAIERAAVEGRLVGEPELRELLDPGVVRFRL
ncbi:MAG: M14 family zinc carboxypeptidase, partial [Planctomycetota bacterium]